MLSPISRNSYHCFFFIFIQLIDKNLKILNFFENFFFFFKLKFFFIKTNFKIALTSLNANFLFLQQADRVDFFIDEYIFSAKKNLSISVTKPNLINREPNEFFFINNNKNSFFAKKEFYYKLVNFFFLNSFLEFTSFFPRSRFFQLFFFKNSKTSSYLINLNKVISR
jgi:hypothetical protein